MGEIRYKLVGSKKSRGLVYYTYEFIQVVSLSKRTAHIRQIGYDVTKRTRGPGYCKPDEENVLEERTISMSELDKYVKYDDLRSSLPSAERIWRD